MDYSDWYTAFPLPDQIISEENVLELMLPYRSPSSYADPFSFQHNAGFGFAECTQPLALNGNLPLDSTDNLDSVSSRTLAPSLGDISSNIPVPTCIWGDVHQSLPQYIECSNQIYTNCFDANHTLEYYTVWKATEEFIELALKDVYLDERIYDKLQRHIIEPNLMTMKRRANRSLQDLLNCRGLGNSGFFDSFGETRVQEHLQLRQRCGNIPVVNGFAELAVSVVSTLASQMRPEEILDKTLVGKVILEKMKELLAPVRKSLDKDTASRRLSIYSGGILRGELYPSVLCLNLAYLISSQPTMTAFIGYVNSLVVENCVTRLLPADVFNVNGILDTKQEVIDKIATEDEQDVENRRIASENPDAMKQIMEQLENFNLWTASY
ncbi:hypothetical protein P154DRAFT_579442 [Amniculicola lignicola CBS 123094]|uniref:Uncharacterized protein n=1 Tax=Amniculicola lignicola CBS 123094 TaxID=1392246 RepID=A0A6A5WCE1_9PLEO|nr:hypothetical protein P154DRAFT_579442 [Amniculicola lignicola CBS 123094]